MKYMVSVLLYLVLMAIITPVTNAYVYSSGAFTPTHFQVKPSNTGGVTPMSGAPTQVTQPRHPVLGRFFHKKQPKQLGIPLHR
jgi:hypothetical protein